MVLHNPILNLNVEPFEKRVIKYIFHEKGKYINIEGFENDKIPCIDILASPLLKNKYSYQGIKHGVNIIPYPIIERKKRMQEK